jgi:hypothetical protein
MFPKQAEMAGIDFRRLVDSLLRLALEREGPSDPVDREEEER